MDSKRMVNTKFWSDGYVSELEPTEKLLFLYLITNERVDISGIYELPLKFMSFETGIKKEELIRILDRFERDEKVFYADGFVFVKNFIKNQNCNSDSIVIAIKNKIEELPSQIRKKIENKETVWGRCGDGVRMVYTRYGEIEREREMEREKKKKGKGEMETGSDTIPPTPLFENFFLAYPKKAGRESAERLWRSMKLDNISVKIMNFVALAKETDRWKRGFVPSSKNFLEERRWEDDLDTYADAKPNSESKKKLGLIC